MKAKKQRKPSSDVAMQDMSDPKPEPMPKPRPRRAKKSSAKPPKAAVGKLAKFKEEQHLKIETKGIGEEGQGDAESKAPPSSSKKKRRRAAEIDRKYRCTFGDCDKAYGSESSLSHHQKLKHPKEMAEAAAEAQENQASTYAVHTRNVSIRPATPLVTFASDSSLLLTPPATSDLSDGFVSQNDVAPPSAKAARRNMRSRSNSEPVSLTDGLPAPIVSIPKPRAKTPRKPRRPATPHPQKATNSSVRRAKMRSKSESLPEMLSFEPLTELKMPPPRPIDGVLDPILPHDSGGRGSFEWPIPTATASAHHSTSLSSDEQAIDSDILSVLVDCDAEDVGDPSVLDFAGPSSTNSFQSSNASFPESEDAETLPVGMECFKISENATLPTETPTEFAMNEPEAELGLSAFATLGDDWHLSSHLEKMTVETPPDSLNSMFGRLSAGEGNTGRLRSASDLVHAAAAAPIHPALSHFSSMPLEPLAVKSNATCGSIVRPSPGGNELLGHNYQQWLGDTAASGAVKSQSINSQQEMPWAPTEAGVATVGNPQPTSRALDELLQHEDAVEWKAASEFETDNTGVNYAGMASTLL